jgi:hypothetical protein
LVALFLSNFLADKLSLEHLGNTKIIGSSKEFLLTLLAIASVVGVWAIVAVSTKENRFLNSIAHKIMLEIPRTCYYFGSSITGVLAAVCLFLSNNPKELSGIPLTNFLSITFTFGFMFFVIGCIFSVALISELCNKGQHH